MKKEKTWKVELRTTCKTCGGELPTARHRTFCSDKCRIKSYNDARQESGFNTAYQKMQRDKIASIPDPEHKCQCLICGKWYVQVCSHAYQTHGMTGREYREYFELEVKRGVVPDWYRKLKGEQAIDNETYKNLEKGAKFRFKKGDKRAGDYQRSPVTLERLKNLHKYNKKS